VQRGLIWNSDRLIALSMNGIRHNALSRRRRKESRTRFRKFVKFVCISAVPAVVGVLSAIAAIPTFFPRLSLASPQSVRTHDPMGTVFVLTNNGVFAIHDVDAQCVVSTVQTRGTSFANLAFKTEPAIPELSAGTEMSLSCQNIDFGGPAETAHIVIQVKYRPSFGWWKRTTFFPMNATRADDGTWVWIRKAQ
jgi:hypothetical protein